MRRLATPDRIREFMRRLGREARTDTRIYLTGGATALLLDWRATTIDVDIKITPERDDVLRALPAIKESLQLNVELASPDQFIPPLPGWEDRSSFICREGHVDWHHFDFYSQALSKISRDHDQDRLDVQEMLARGLIERVKLHDLFERIRPHLFRYPSIDPGKFASRVDKVSKSVADPADPGRSPDGLR